MALANRLRHTVVIERSADGAVDERGIPDRTFAELATVQASIQPKSVREVAALSQAGATVSNFTIFLLPTDVTAADRIHDTDAGCSYADDRFELMGIRDAAGKGHHLEVDANRVWVD